MYRKTICTDKKVFIMNLRDLHITKTEIARKMGVTEGTIRYHINRNISGATDGRKLKYSEVSEYKSIIDYWINEYKDSRHRPTLQVFYNNLKDFHDYRLGYDALRRYIRKHYPDLFKKGTKIRLETPPGVLMQIDWKESVNVQVGKIEHWVKLHFLLLILCFSRKVVVRVSDKKDLDSLIRCHQEAFKALGGLPQWIRPDCMKTVIVKWNGQNSVITEQYQRYMEGLGIKVFPARPYTPADKGKIEKRIQDVFNHLELQNIVFKNLEEVQQYVEQKIAVLENKWLSGATGVNVARSFEYEKKYLKPLPEIFPKLPVKELRTTVRRDGTVYFDGNYYQVRQIYIDRSVLCLHTGTKILIYYGGEEIETYDYLPGMKGMVRLSKDAINQSQTPISDMTRKWALEVADRQLEYYEDISRRAIV
jgi:transposase